MIEEAEKDLEKEVQEEIYMKEALIEFEEYQLETDVEVPEVTQFYIKESKKLKKVEKEKKQTYGKSVQIIGEEESDEEEEDELEQRFLESSTNTKKDAQRIEKLVKGVKAEGEDELLDIQDDAEMTEEAKRMEKAEINELEKMI